MSNRVLTGAIVVAAAGAAMILAPSVASASTSDPYPCGFSRSYGAGVWNNCVDNNQLIAMTVTDTLTNETFAEYQCVEAQTSEILMPTYFVWDGTVAADC